MDVDMYLKFMWIALISRLKASEHEIRATFSNMIAYGVLLQEKMQGLHHEFQLHHILLGNDSLPMSS